jgi:hypothetical protein
VRSSSLTLNFISLSLAAPSTSCSSSSAWCYQAIPQVRSHNEVIEMKTLIAKVAPLQEVRTEKARLSNKFLVCHIHTWF